MKHPKIWLGIGIGILAFLIVFLSCFYGISRINYQYNRKTDSYTVTGMYGQSSKIVIAGNINGKPVRKIASRAFYHNTHIEEVIFEDPSCLTEIDRLAFSGCSKLKEISLEEVQNIGRNAFEDCVSLEEVTLTVTDLLGSVFYGCSRLKKVTLKQTESIGTFAFAETGLEEITLPFSVKYVYVDAFYHCASLKKIYVGADLGSHNEYLKELGICEFLS